MDIKAMAKSKRSHTQHHPKKPHPPSKPTNTNATSSSSTTTKQQVKHKNKAPPQPRPPSLPSNWARYGDEDEDNPIGPGSDSDDPSPEVKPKSKGADYSTLIAQARESRAYYSPSFDDNFPDSYQGVAPMLALRGQKIVLEHRDDDFLMEDEGHGAQEAPFLTLDLKDLAARLSNIDLAQRLFIEPELLPPELHDQDDNNGAKRVQSPVRHKIERIDSFGELLALFLEEEKMAEKQDDANENSTYSSNVSNRHVAEHDSKGDLIETKSKDLGKSTLPKCDAEDLEFLDKDTLPHVSSVPKQDATHSSRFEAASAEAELDMLLGSFNETKISDTATNQSGSSYNLEHISTYGDTLKHPVVQSRPAFPVTSNLDDELDNLLAETSTFNNDKNAVIQPMTKAPSSSLPPPNSKISDLGNFDSWMDTLS